MALTRSIGAALETAGTGTNPIDVRKGLGGLFIRAGILPGGTNPLVSGTAGWAYSLAVGSWVTQTATGDGYHLWGNDGAVTVGTSGVGGTVPAAPGAGLSRIDILWVRHPSNGENGDTTSAPAAGVMCGTATSSPTAPALPTGAFELARNTMTSAATTTASTGNTITQTAPYTAPQGGVVLCRNATELAALTSLATAARPLTADVGGIHYTCNDAVNWRLILASPQIAAGMPAVNVDSFGRVAIRPATGSTGALPMDAALLVEPRVAAAPAVVVRGLAGQTEPLQQWMDSTGFVFAAVNPTNATNTSYQALNFGGLGTRTIEMGPADSGGAGYRMLRIPN